MTTVAIADEFLDAYGRLPEKAQKKTQEFTRKFRENPRQASIHYESILRARDPNLRSVRIGNDYRAILRAPEHGDVFVLLWVDHHDEAYRWAENRRVDINRATGALQVYRLLDELPSPLKAPLPVTAAASAARFSTVTDDELDLVGVPKVLLPVVRNVYSDGDLDEIVRYLPREAAEILIGIAAGLSLNEAIDESWSGKSREAVDIEDIGAALQRPASGKSFRVLDDSFDLEAALAYPLDKWRVFLHPMQRVLASRTQAGSASVTGGAGTGKTVVAMHRAVALVRDLLRPSDEVLFTTFTTNLAEDIRTSLAKIASPDEMERVTVRGIVTVAMEIVKSADESARLAERNVVDEFLTEALSSNPLPSLSREFFRAEWRDVIVAQGISDVDTYLAAKRTGRGVTLVRSDRRKIWPVFASVQAALRVRGLFENREIVRRARELIERRGAPRYAAVVVDEAQDMDADALRLIRALAGPEHENDVFLVGDAHQRIYGRPIALSSCGINVRGRRSRKLRINYRTTDAILRFAMRSLGDETYDDLEDGTVSSKGEASLRTGVRPVVRNFTSSLEERAFVVAEIKRLVEVQRAAPESICVMARTHELLHSGYKAALSELGIGSVEVVREGAPEPAAVRLSTMHRAKGLEYPHVFIVGANDGLVPLDTEDLRSVDAIVAANALRQERCLFYVATSRARDALTVTSSGRPSRFITSVDTQIRPYVDT